MFVCLVVGWFGLVWMIRYYNLNTNYFSSRLTKASFRPQPHGMLFCFVKINTILLIIQRNYCVIKIKLKTCLSSSSPHAETKSQLVNCHLLNNLIEKMSRHETSSACLIFQSALPGYGNTGWDVQCSSIHHLTESYGMLWFVLKIKLYN